MLVYKLFDIRCIPLFAREHFAKNNQLIFQNGWQEVSKRLIPDNLIT